MKRSLNNTVAKNAKPNTNGKSKKYTDGGGLYLLVSQKGKYWRYNYKFRGKYKTLALGVYPSISLKKARSLHEEARDLLSKKIDPSLNKRLQKDVEVDVFNSFEVVAREWYAGWKGLHSMGHTKRIFSRLEKDVFPWLGHRPMLDIEPPEILMILRRIEERGALETAHRVMQSIGQVFKYGVATGRAKRDQTADLKGALPSYRKKHFPALTDPKDVGHLLRVIDAYKGSLIVRCAFRLTPLVMLRPAELAGAEWSEIDFDTAVWTIPIARMKALKAIKDENSINHIIPLSRQAITILKEIQPLTGRFQHVFTGARCRSKPMNPSTINVALKRLGYQDVMKAHSFRTMASSMLNGMGFNPDAIEKQLGHKDKDRIRAVYNRAQYLEERREMLQYWADYLDSLRVGVDITPPKKRA
jgi:integrase